MKPETFTYDVFVAYSTDERIWVRGKLLPYLEKAGLHVCIDYRDFQRGASRITEIERALRTSKRTLLVLSPHYQYNEWTHLEQFFVLPEHPVNEQSRIVPLLREKYTIPHCVSHLNLVDFTSPAPEQRQNAWNQLLTALGAPPFQEAPEPNTRDHWLLVNPYPMPPNFTGRVYERDQLTSWLNANYEQPLFVMRAPGGFGKSTLCWQWLTRDVHPARWRRVVWWGFQEKETCFAQFLYETLVYLGVEDAHTLGQRQQIDTIIQFLRQPEGENILLVLDGYEREMLGFSGANAPYQGDEPREHVSLMTASQQPTAAHRDSVNPLADYFLHAIATLPTVLGKVVLLSRLRPHALETKTGELLPRCREMEPGPLQPNDAISFFHAQGIRGSDAEIEHACAFYGYHPLSIRILAGYISNDSQQPGDIALAQSITGRGDMLERQNHLFYQAYTALSESSQKMLARLACFREPVTYAMLKMLAQTEEQEAKHQGEQDQGNLGIMGFLKTIFRSSTGTPSLLPSADSRRSSDYLVGEDKPTQILNSELRDLLMRGLLLYERNSRSYTLHPLIRRMVYELLTSEEQAMHHRHIHDTLSETALPETITTLTDLSTAIERYYQTVRLHWYDEAAKGYFATISEPIIQQFAAYDVQIAMLRMLFPSGETRPPHLTDEQSRSQVLLCLAQSYSSLGFPKRALPLYELAMVIQEKQGDRLNQAHTLVALASFVHMPMGAWQSADGALSQASTFYQQRTRVIEQAYAHQKRSMLLAYRGAWDESARELTQAQQLLERHEYIEHIGMVWVYRALRALLLARLPIRPIPTSAPLTRVDQPGKSHHATRDAWSAPGSGQEMTNRETEMCDGEGMRSTTPPTKGEPITGKTEQATVLQPNLPMSVSPPSPTAPLPPIGSPDPDSPLSPLPAGEPIVREPEHPTGGGEKREREAQRTNAKMEALTAAERGHSMLQEVLQMTALPPQERLMKDWVVGAAYRLHEKWDDALAHLQAALTQSRHDSLLVFEAAILLELAWVHRAMHQTEVAQHLAQETQALAERCGYVLQQADIALFFAQVSLDEGDRKGAAAYAHQAREFARCGGPPNHTYKAAYDEALALLSLLREDGDG